MSPSLEKSAQNRVLALAGNDEHIAALLWPGLKTALMKELYSYAVLNECAGIFAGTAGKTESAPLDVSFAPEIESAITVIATDFAQRKKSGARLPENGDGVPVILAKIDSAAQITRLARRLEKLKRAAAPMRETLNPIIVHRESARGGILSNAFNNISRTVPRDFTVERKNHESPVYYLENVFSDRALIVDGDVDIASVTGKDVYIIATGNVSISEAKNDLFIIAGGKVDISSVRGDAAVFAGGKISVARIAGDFFAHSKENFDYIGNVGGQSYAADQNGINIRSANNQDLFIKEPVFGDLLVKLSLLELGRRKPFSALETIALDGISEIAEFYTDIANEKGDGPVIQAGRAKNAPGTKRRLRKAPTGWK